MGHDWAFMSGQEGFNGSSAVGQDVLEISWVGLMGRVSRSPNLTGPVRSGRVGSGHLD